MSPDRLKIIPSLEQIGGFFRDNPPIYTCRELLETPVNELITGSQLPAFGYRFIDYSIMADGVYNISKTPTSSVKLDDYIEIYEQGIYRLKSKSAFPHLIRFEGHHLQTDNQFGFTIIENERLPQPARYTKHLIGFLNPTF